jgi:hypothetical protein
LLLIDTKFNGEDYIHENINGTDAIILGAVTCFCVVCVFVWAAALLPIFRFHLMFIVITKEKRSEAKKRFFAALIKLVLCLVEGYIVFPSNIFVVSYKKDF